MWTIISSSPSPSIDSAAAVEEALVKSIKDLRDQAEYGSEIYALMKKRKDAIQAMVDFEERASDKKRLFGNSRQLMDEEKWRKTAYPNLLKLEDQLAQAVLGYEEGQGRLFIIEDSRFLETLQQEISDRVINPQVF
ncbi:MAG: hypothetical protein DHS80DRAFT_13150, partial [Piptocephalis tieghemiana]